MASMAKWARVRMNMAIHGPFLSSPSKSRLGSDFCFGSGRMRSRVVRNVITNSTTQIIAHRPMVICQPLALSPCPNLATRGSVKPTTMSCAIMAETKRNDDSRVRSLTSPVMTPLNAEYGVLLAEYSVINITLVNKAYVRLPVIPRPGFVYARIIAIPQGTDVQSTHGRNFPQRVLVLSLIHISEP